MSLYDCNSYYTVHVLYKGIYDISCLKCHVMLVTYVKITVLLCLAFVYLNKGTICLVVSWLPGNNLLLITKTSIS